MTRAHPPLARIEAINAERTIPLEVYQDHGHIDRFDYLMALADEHDLTLEQVLFAADAFGSPDEDFDGLVTTLEDDAAFLRGC